MFCGILAEAAVDNEQFAVCFDWVFAFNFFNRNVAVDDVAVWTFDAKVTKKFFAPFALLAKFVIAVFLFFVPCFVINVDTFESCHFVFAEEW